MGMLDRFTDIIKANVNDLLDRAEDPSKMVDQYLRDLTESLAEVKQETAGVMAEEERTERQVKENEADISKYDGLSALSGPGLNQRSDGIFSSRTTSPFMSLRALIRFDFPEALAPYTAATRSTGVPPASLRCSGCPSVRPGVMDSSWILSNDV